QLGSESGQFDKDISEWSEGQKKKALIAASLSTPAHLYIWDEPLNFIDIFSRMQIEKLLLEYEPTMIFVEHDRNFTDSIATKKIAL
ncbi:MAG: ABC-F family ATP-binding cassette domain-containing protein, partial [Oscillospiraceae bacterium]|nr:ABC-F family ATP-binding cassette domain-containing protein [Oscillospiraceae bacterium]